jgi:Flp pilus assembly pilin Flp
VKNLLARMWRETDGVLSFEWTMLTSLLTVGVVSGVAAVRDSVTDEMGDLAQAMVSLDQSYYIQPPLVIYVHNGNRFNGFGGFGGFGGTVPVSTGFGFGNAFGATSHASDSYFIDASSYDDCTRAGMKVIEFPRQSDRPAPATPMVPAEEELTPAL